jgi:light-regulated signal transduction histidine kinase (bacteriophytochrome)
LQGCFWGAASFPKPTAFSTLRWIVTNIDGTAVMGPDLATCDSEPIHRPNSIQPHGVLLALAEPEQVVVAVSFSIERHLGIAPAGVLGTKLSDLTSAATCDRLREVRANPQRTEPVAWPLEIGLAGAKSRWLGLAHQQDHLSLLELEPLTVPPPGDSALLMVSDASRRLHATTTTTEACQVAAEEVRRITGLDRVKTYRFASDWSGEVLGEARDEAMPSYLGLHFPASDIPGQARTLYRTNSIRLIVDVGYENSPLVAGPGLLPAPIDLSYSILRSVSPIHLAYLRNMQVGASMSVSVLRNGALWGMIACHHRTPLHVGFELRQACQLVAELLASQLDMLEKLARVGRRSKVEQIRARMANDMADGHAAAESVERQGKALLDLVGASGFAMVRPGATVRVGQPPDDSALAELRAWLDVDPSSAAFQTDRLGEVYRPATAYLEAASGLMAVPLSGMNQGYLFWCRPELPQTVTWAGQPSKSVEQVTGALRLQPRESFMAWTEEMHGRSAPWADQDVAAAQQMRDTVVDLMLREKDELTRQNLRLVHSMKGLETFIFIASHDIHSPLRQMEMLISMLRHCIAADKTEEAAEYLAEFGALSTRLRTLITKLSEFARAGRSDVDFAPVNLNEVVQAVVRQLHDTINEAGAEIIAADLPVVRGEREHLYQVFANLIGNSLKYRATDRSLKVSITSNGGPAAQAADLADAEGMAWIAIDDNGIGFDPKFNEQIFDPFERLHARDRDEGTGLGLSICRRIIERHGGRITARGVINGGLHLTLSLQCVPAERTGPES